MREVPCLFCFIEVKHLGKEPTVDQLARHKERTGFDEFVLVADSFESFLDQFKTVVKTIR